MQMSILRVPAAIVLLAAAGVAIAPQMTNHISSAAVVNAPLVSVYAPFDGTIMTASLGAAAPIKAGDTITVIKDARSQSVNLRSLKSEIATTSGEISGIETQRRRMQDLKADLIKRRADQVNAKTIWFGPRLQEAQADVAVAAAEVSRTQDAALRIAQLEGKGSVTKRDVLAAEADLAAAEARHAHEVATVSRLEVERDYLQTADSIDLATNSLEQLNYRLDEIALRDADLYTRLLTLQTRRAALQGEISGLELEKARNDTFSPKSVADGIIWEVSGQAGTNVASGEQIAQVLDCSRRFVEVMISETYTQSIRPGDNVSVQLKGDKSRFKAVVYAVYGSGARPNRKMQAAQPRIETPDGLRVIVGIGAADVSAPGVARSFCDVGRSAEVHFAMKSISAVSALVSSLRDMAGLSPVMTAKLEDSDAPTTVN